MLVSSSKADIFHAQVVTHGLMTPLPGEGRSGVGSAVARFDAGDPLLTGAPATWENTPAALRLARSAYEASSVNSRFTSCVGDSYDASTVHFSAAMTPIGQESQGGQIERTHPVPMPRSHS
jgi:hypothetical protein